MTGKGEYDLDQAGTTSTIAAEDVVITPTGCVHGVQNAGAETSVFLSVISPATAKYQLVSPKVQRVSSEGTFVLPS